MIIDDLQEYWTYKTVELTDPAGLNQSQLVLFWVATYNLPAYLPQPSRILVLSQPSCILAAAFPHTFNSLAAAFPHTFSSLPAYLPRPHEMNIHD